MASGRKWYCAERYAHRDGYIKNKDLDGKVLESNDGLKRFGDCPSTMTTSLDYESLVRDWCTHIDEIPEGSPGHKADVRQSEDAGRYLCDYIYFNSLAYFGRKCGDVEGGACTARPVLFLHVPAESDATTLANGRAVAMALIQAMANDLATSTTAND
ncbi:uncharacterized protein RCC_00561 [Ramularia collo-cygni]|uniref:Peptidase C15, pyroglutamyl peptidase I-like protein n=1 Tax=Ramularia collo-cygni TaxID=112498 RepID=A0A2D3UUK2_9PEZI|nr:uncharacterized protein RCC_00561 [Ramularia collo-cygni]CZT14586.1 uncharacterized protein RCC_00561 [Ramularia collo-cygni]